MLKINKQAVRFTAINVEIRLTDQIRKVQFFTKTATLDCPDSGGTS
jgi:hypothetical protein